MFSQLSFQPQTLGVSLKVGSVSDFFLFSVLSDVESPPGPGVGSVKPETVDTVPSVTDQATRDQVEFMVLSLLLIVLGHLDHFSDKIG